MVLSNQNLCRRDKKKHELSSTMSQISKIRLTVLLFATAKGHCYSRIDANKALKNTCVSANKSKKFRVGRSENVFIFLLIFNCYK